MSTYLKISKDSKIPMRGQDHEGNTALMMAACEEEPNMISLLTEKGARVKNRIAAEGTPLMEAVLWVRVENVRFLLRDGANRTFKDRGDRIAADLAALHI